MVNLKVSVITVCLNCRGVIAGTVQSVIGQTYKNIEYIVIDGGSSDGTGAYFESVRDKLSLFVSEPDGGIYDAMNKGIKAASGDYIIFINAGDMLASSDIIERLMTSPEIIGGRPQIISGRVRFAYNGALLDYYRPSKLGREGPGLPHQATLVRADIQKANLFDPRFRFVGDYELWRRLQANGLFEVRYIWDIISIFSFGGASTDIKKDARRYLERAYVDYFYSGTFGVGDWLKFIGKILARRAVFTLLGEKTFFIYLRCVKFVKTFLGIDFVSYP